MGHYATRYVVEAKHPDGRRYRVGSTVHKSRSGLLVIMRNAGPALIEALPIGEDDEIAFKARPVPHATTTGGWWIGFTGETEKSERAEASAAPALPTATALGVSHGE